jgi:uncharacterized protein (UPF0261 family)
MTTRIAFPRIGAVLAAKLDGEVAAIAQIEGVSFSSQLQQVAVDFVTEPSPAVQTQVQAVITAHDPTDTEAVLRTTDYADLLAMAESGLTQIAADQADVQAGLTAANADKTSLVGSPTQAQVLAVVRRMVDRELVLYADLNHILTRQDKIIRVLRHVVRS